MFNYFSNNLKKTLQASLEISRHYSKKQVGSKEIILAMIYGQTSLGKKMLLEAGLFLDKSTVVLPSGKHQTKTLSPEQFSTGAKEIIQLAIQTAYNHKNFFVGTEHILYACLQQPDKVAYAVLKNFNIDIPRLEKKLIFVFKANQEFNTLSKIWRSLANVKNLPTKPTKHKTALDFFCRDLNRQAINDKLDPLIGRDKEINRLINVLLRRNKNNPLLIGSPGVGKTALVEGLAQRIVNQNVPKMLAHKKILVLDLAGLIAGTMFRGEFESRLRQIIEEVEKSKNIIIFIDEIHNVVGTGNTSGSLDTANILKPALARGSFQLIGATTLDEYQKYFEQDKALVRRFQVIEVSEPSEDESYKILQGLKPVYEKFHNVNFDNLAIRETVKLSQRYITEKFLPDKAIDLLDEAAALVRSNTPIPDLSKNINNLRVKIKEVKKQKIRLIEEANYSEALFYKGREKRLQDRLKNLKTQLNKSDQTNLVNIGQQDIRFIAEQITNIPITELEKTTKRRIIDLEKIIGRQILGQAEIIKEVSQTIRRAKAGLANSMRPLASFLFLGPSGVGKTEMAKVIAKEVFGDIKNLVKIDMSEFRQGFTSSRLIGAPAGYVGFEQGGMLTEKIRHQPYSVVLFDEIEKAHPENISLLLQILEDGQLSDHKGHTVNFRNTIIILTSNIGHQNEALRTEAIGFKTTEEKRQLSAREQEEAKEIILSNLKQTLPPEFINRLDKIQVFNQLTKKDLVKIARREISLLLNSLKEKNYKIKLDTDIKALNYIATLGEEQRLGARPIRRLVSDNIGDQIAKLILEAGDRKEFKISIKFIQGKIVVKSL